MINSVLVLCIGNICRSPIAEAMLARKFKDSGFDTKVSSAGLGALVNSPADPISQELSLENGLDISGHRARQLTSEIARSADLIITMSSDQTKEVVRLYPFTAGRVHRVGKWEGFDIPDPYRRPKVIFEQAYHLIKLGIDEWVAKVKHDASVKLRDEELV